MGKFHCGKGIGAVAVSNELKAFRQFFQSPEGHVHSKDTGADTPVIRHLITDDGAGGGIHDEPDVGFDTTDLYIGFIGGEDGSFFVRVLIHKRFYTDSGSLAVVCDLLMGDADVIEIPEDLGGSSQGKPQIDIWKFRHRDMTCALCLLNFREEAFFGKIKDSKKPDHGALSAIIFLLHFYKNGAIYTLSPYKKASIELAALAIYNHTNKYGIQGEDKYIIYRPCFSLNPISYLLRMCDDLQEWERIYFVISDNSNIVLCNKCKTPVIGSKEKNEKEIITRYRCNCQFLSADGQNDKRDADRHIHAFDGRSKFSYRRIYNVSVCDSVVAEGNAKADRKLLFKLHYDPYKLLHVAYLNATYAKYRISELNSLKLLFECQKGIPKIYLDYFVTSNPVHIKVRMMEEYLEYRYTPDKNSKTPRE